MSSLPNFEYNPRREQLLEATKGQKSCKIYIDEIQQDGKPEELTQGQIKLIQKVFNEQIHLSSDTDHHIRVTILGQSKFSITIDGESRFFITKHGAAINSPVVAIQERIKQRTFMTSVLEFFQTIANIFYKPTYPSPDLKDRKAKVAVSQDYRAFRKALQEGRSWFRSKDDIRLTSPQQAERTHMNREIDDLIRNATKIEKALDSKNKEEKLYNLADEFAQEVFYRLKNDNAMVIPVGYLNSDNVLQPVMLRFEKNAEDKLFLEIYADSAEGKSDIPPLHRREFNDDVKKSHIKAVLDAAFQPMITPKSRTSALKKAAERNELFSAIHNAELGERLAEARSKLKSSESEGKTAKTNKNQEDSGDHLVSLTFEAFLRDIDQKMKDYWTEGEVDKTAVRQASSPSERIVAWFNHLIRSDEHKLTTNEKLNLMFFITEDYAQDQLQQVKGQRKKVGLEKQLEVYKRVAGQIAHMRDNIAVSLNNGHPLDTEGVPQSLRDTEALCNRKIEKIERKLLRKKRVGASQELNKKQSALLGFNIGATRVSPPVKPTVSLAQAEEVQEIDEVAWRDSWQTSVEDVRKLFTQENVIANRGRQIASEVYALADRKSSQLAIRSETIAHIGLESKKYEDFTPKEQLAYLESLLASSISLIDEDKSILGDAVKKAQLENADVGAILGEQSVKFIVARVSDISSQQIHDISDKIESLKKIKLEELVVDGEVKTDKLEAVINAIVESMDDEGLFELQRGQIGLNKKQLKILLKQIVLDPHHLPVFPTTERIKLANAFQEIVLAIDPQAASGSKYSSIADDLRAIVNLRLLLPRAELAKQAETRWKELRSIYKERNLATINRVLQSEIDIRIKDADEAEDRYQILEEIKQMLPALVKQSAVAANGITEENEQAVSEIKMLALEEVLKVDEGEREEELQKQIESLKAQLLQLNDNVQKAQNLSLAIEELENGYFQRELDEIEGLKAGLTEAHSSLEIQKNIYTQALVITPLEEKQKFLLDRIANLKSQLGVESEDGGDKRQEKILNNAIINLEKNFKDSRWMTTLGSMDTMIRINAFLDKQNDLPEVYSVLESEVIPSPDVSSLSRDQASEALTASNQTLANKVTELTQALDQLSVAAASEVDPIKKKAIYEEIKTRSLELLSLLPPPGTDGASGTPSIWSALNPKQSENIRNSLQRLQHHVWEAQMRLTKNEMTGKEKFMMIKAQAINMALVRTEVSRQSKAMEEVLTDIHRRDPSSLSEVVKSTGVSVSPSGRVVINLQKMMPSPSTSIIKNLTTIAIKYRADGATINQILNEQKKERPKEADIFENTLKGILLKTNETTFNNGGISWDADTQTLVIDWDAVDLDWAALQSYFENHTIMLEDHSALNPMILTLDPWTLDTMEINRVLTQDLTTCLSQDARLDQEVQAVYHFVLTDKNRGINNELKPEFEDRSSEGRAPLLYDFWKHMSDCPIVNPLLRTLEPETLILNLPQTPKTQLVSELYKKNTSNAQASKQVLIDIFSESNADASFESASKAISWNHESKELNIDWQNPELEWDQLIDIVSKSDPNIKSTMELISVVKQTSQGKLYYSTAADPDFTLYRSAVPDSPTGLSYFQQEPDLLLNQRQPLELRQVHVGVVKLEAGHGTSLAEVYIYGKEGVADMSSMGKPPNIDEELEPLLMRPKTPFLPTVNHDHVGAEVTGFVTEAGLRGLEDIRQLHTYDVWKEYVQEISGEDVLSIPPHVLLELFKIREAPNDRRNGSIVTSYSSSTAVNALEFLADRRNQTYLQNDFVQQYLFESMFGPMVMQQALVDHPENIITNIEQLQLVLLQAQESKNHELIGFYSTVLKNLGDHIQMARGQVREHGLFAGNLRNLPVFRGKDLGAFHRTVPFGVSSLGTHQNFSFTEAENIDSSSVLDPLAPLWYRLEECGILIDDALREVKNSKESVKSILIGTGEGPSPIDKIKDPQAKRQAYLQLLQEYRMNGLDELKIEDWLQILNGYEFLVSGPQAGGIPQLQSEVTDWVKREVLPQVQDLDPSERDKIIKQIINQKLIAEGERPISDELGNQFSPLANTINQYAFNRADGSTISINLTTMSISGIDLTKRSRSPVAIPKDIMDRKDVQQALQTSVVHAMMTKKGDLATYTWKHEGQNFTLVVEGSKVTIERQIHDHPRLPEGKYTFTPIIHANPDNHAALLLNDNGMWIKEGSPQVGWTFTSGMNVPTEESMYLAMIDDNNNIQELRTLTGCYVSTSSKLDGSSPVLFASAKNTVVMIDAATKKPKELRLPQFNVSMVRTSNNQWQLSQNGKSLGILKATGQEEERFLKDEFGPHWDQFVIPLEDKGGKTTYLMIPYAQSIDKKGRMSADHASIGNIPHPILLTRGPEGNIKGSQAGELYLAHRFLLEAEKTRNPTTARQLFYKAQQHLENISNDPLPGIPEEVDNLKYVLNLLADHPAISLMPAPTALGLLLTIKMELFIQNIRQKAQAEGVRSLQASPEKELEELSKIAKHYQAHRIQMKDVRSKSISQELFKLSKNDVIALEGISQRLLMNISQTIANADSAKYFGATGRLAAKVTMDKPKELDPQFILALVRMAKPYNSEKSLNGVNAPLPVGDLIENFWSYFISIKNEGLTPEDLIFLFDESIIPPVESPEQEEHLRALDLQARQFLIGLAGIMKRAGGKVDQMAEAKSGISEAKTKVKDLTEDGIFQAFIGQFKGNPEIDNNFQLLTEAINGLTVSALPDSEPPIPDLTALGKDLAEVKTHVENFKEALQKSLTAATDLIESANAKHQDFSSALQNARKELNKAQTESESAIQAIEEEYSETSIRRKTDSVEQKAQKAIERLETQRQKIEQNADRELREKEADIEIRLNAELLGKDESQHEALSVPFEKELQEFQAELKERIQRETADIKLRMKKIETEAEAEIKGIRDRYSPEKLEENKRVVIEGFAAKNSELELQVQTKSEELQHFMETENIDPVSAERIPNSEIINGNYAESIELDKLKDSVDQTERMVKDLDKSLKEMKENIDLLDQWNELQGYIQEMETVTVHPSSWFSLPNEGAARDFIEYQIKAGKWKEGDPPLPQEPSIFSAGISMARQMGVVDTIRLARAQSEFSDLSAKLSDIDKELKKEVGDGNDQITEKRRDELKAERVKIRKKMLQNPTGNIEASTAALAPILIASELTSGNQFECKPDDVMDRTASMEKNKVSEVLEGTFAEQCFTPKQLEELRTNLAKLPQDEQLSYAEQLSKALKMNASLVEAQTGLRNNVRAIDNAHREMIKPLTERVPPPTHDFSGKVEGKSRKERYQGFYQGKAEFPDSSKASEVFRSLGEKTKNREDTLTFLRLSIPALNSQAQPPQIEDIEVSAQEPSEQFEDIEASIKRIGNSFARHPEDFEPYLEALHLITKANTPEYIGDSFEIQPVDRPSVKVTINGHDHFVIAPQDSSGNVVLPFTAEFNIKVIQAETGEDLLLAIQDAYEKLAPIIEDIDHQKFVKALRDQTIPEDSLYADDLKKGFDKISRENPLAFSQVIGEEQVENVAKTIQEDVAELTGQIADEQKEIIARLKAIPLDNLPKSLQKIRMRKGNDQELLHAAFKEYRKGSFDETDETLSEGQLSLDALIGKCLIDRTRKNVLQGARFNAASSVEHLTRLRSEKADLKQRLNAAKAEFELREKNILRYREHALQRQLVQADIEALIPEDYTFLNDEQKEAYIQILLAKRNNKLKPSTSNRPKEKGDVSESGEYYRIVEEKIEEYGLARGTVDRYVEKKNFDAFEAVLEGVQERLTLKKAEIDELQSQLDALNSTWKKESASISDFTDRCQSSEHLTKLPKSLKPYGRHINFLQEKMGLVLREDQISTLDEIVKNPALLKQLRMGLGKTSIIVPFALMILGAKGHNTIGMVPKALFTTNFDEMDDTTRTVFELSGNQFLFSRQDATFPLNSASLHKLSQKCAGFLKALERGEYILTTIESKASLDNKISELERSQSLVQGRIDMLKQDEESDHKAQIEPLFQELVNHQIALDMLYRVKDVFEADRTRLIIDEVDTVAKANYSVNSESGVKTPISKDILAVSVDIFDAIRGNDKMQAIFAKIQENNQFTLNEDEVNEAIKDIGEILIKDYPQLQDKKEEILDWFAGLRDCPFDHSELRELGRVKNKIMIIRKALNSGLRSSLGLKAGLSCDFDPIHGAIGVPASQGVTSKTTKYSDPLMQVILTQMIALYKPQGEVFLKATSLEVIEEMKKEIKSIDERLGELPEENMARLPLLAKMEELNSGIFKLSKLVNPAGLLKELETELKAVEAEIQVKSTDSLEARKATLEQEVQELKDYIVQIADQSPPLLEKEIAGQEPINVLLRQRFAQQVAKRGDIYVSTIEMTRPVQHALRGCHVIGLTGTATRNTEHVVTSTEHNKALDGVTAAGRETTAEVVFRFVKALTKPGESPEQVLKTPVKTYSLNPEAAFQEFVNLAKKGSGYRFIVNQAGSCDHMSLRELTDKLHQSTKRPIVYLDMDEDGRTEKVAIINGARRPLSRLSEKEKELVQEEGFFYYHTPHVRGTHFDIPSGSRGALMMSPKVNANDRDQAIYRARGLGEGHVVEPFISKKQSDEFSSEHDGAAMTIGDMLKIQHEQTREDEGKEDLSAYTLHIKGMVTLEVDRAKKSLQLMEGRAKHVGEWMRTTDRDLHFADIEAKVEAFQILENVFVKDTGNDAYLRQLESEMRQGGTMGTKEYLCEIVIPGERARIELYMKRLQGIDTTDKPHLEKAIEIIAGKLKNADAKLAAEAKKIEKNWVTLERQLPKVTSSAQATQETAETEAEAEAEAVAETTSETEAESSQRRRSKKTRGILMEPDLELLGQIRSNAKSVTTSDTIRYITLPNYKDMQKGPDGSRYMSSMWKDDVMISPRLKHIMQEASLGQPPQIKAVVVESEKGAKIVLTDAGDANQLTGHFSFFTQNPAKGQSILTTGFSVTPCSDEDGMIRLRYGGTGTFGQSRRTDFKDNYKLQADIYFALLILGYNLISDEGWQDMEQAWNKLDEAQQKNLREELENNLSDATLQKAALRLWNKPKDKIVPLGGALAGQPPEKASTQEAGLQGIIQDIKGLDSSVRKRNAERWIGRNADEGIQDDLYALVERVINWNVDADHLFDQNNLTQN